LSFSDPAPTTTAAFQYPFRSTQVVFGKPRERALDLRLAATAIEKHDTKYPTTSATCTNVHNDNDDGDAGSVGGAFGVSSPPFATAAAAAVNRTRSAATDKQ
jgi:hypothetical protein